MWDCVFRARRAVINVPTRSSACYVRLLTVPWLSGRASASHAEGRWFDPSRDHRHTPQSSIIADDSLPVTADRTVEPDISAARADRHRVRTKPAKTDAIGSPPTRPDVDSPSTIRPVVCKPDRAAAAAGLDRRAAHPQSGLPDRCRRRRNHRVRTRHRRDSVPGPGWLIVFAGLGHSGVGVRVGTSSRCISRRPIRRVHGLVREAVAGRQGVGRLLFTIVIVVRDSVAARHLCAGRGMGRPRLDVARESHLDCDADRVARAADGWPGRYHDRAAAAAGRAWSNLSVITEEHI